MKLPCKTCITLAMCRIKAVDRVNKNEVDVNLNSLIEKCVLFKVYCLRVGCTKLSVFGDYNVDPDNNEYFKLIRYFSKGREHIFSVYQKHKYGIKT